MTRKWSVWRGPEAQFRFDQAVGPNLASTMSCARNRTEAWFAASFFDTVVSAQLPFPQNPDSGRLSLLQQSYVEAGHRIDLLLGHYMALGESRVIESAEMMENGAARFRLRFTVEGQPVNAEAEAVMNDSLGRYVLSSLSFGAVRVSLSDYVQRGQERIVPRHILHTTVNSEGGRITEDIRLTEWVQKTDSDGEFEKAFERQQIRSSSRPAAVGEVLIAADGRETVRAFER